MTIKLNRRSRRLMNGASVFTVLASIAALPATAQDDVQEVVVKGQRAALEAAQSRKENADQILDSVSADDAGKLPDNSVTEVLQRIPGVTITRFAAVGDPDHYSVEGSGVTIRGMSQVASYLNGREAFSATGGRALLFEDVPPELLSSIDVVKSPTPDMIEGGIGGAVNLRTKMPFEFHKPTLTMSLEGDYGDFINEAKPSGSVLVADRWMTGIGEIGAMVDIAYSQIAYRHDTIQTEPYYPQTYQNRDVFVPGGFDWRSGTFDRQRLGAYEALQWAPNEDLTFYHTGFRSDYWSTGEEAGVYVQGNNAITVGANSNSSFGSNGGLLKSNDLYSTGWDPLQPAGASGGSLFLANPGATWIHNVTTDLSQGMKWQPSEQLTVNSDFQYAVSSSQTTRIDLFSEGSMPSYSIDLTGSLPSIQVSSASLLANPANYVWDATMDHLENHVGRELAWNTDADYQVSDTGFLRSIKTGVRVAVRNEKDDVSTYNWTGLTPPFDSSYNYLSSASPGDTSVVAFSNFFRGMTGLPGAAVFPSWALAEGYPGNLQSIHEKYGLPGDKTGPLSYNPSNLTHSSTNTVSGYVMARFADETDLPIPFNGNIGVRLVHTQNSSAGAIQQPTGQVLINGVAGTLPGGFNDFSGGRNSFEALPAFNIQFLPREDTHLRFAAYQAMTNPTFTSMSASGSLSLTTDQLHQITGASATVGNPNLKPQISNNLDTSLEWYLPDNGQVHVAGFYKRIHDYISYGVYSESVPFLLPNGGTQNLTTAVANYFNAGQPTTIKGVELGAQKYFNFLPDPFDGFGIDGNFSYIDSQSPGDLSYDMLGNKITGLPVDLLSKYNYNLTALYDKGPISLRLAWSWRSKYLLTPTANGTNGTYTNAAGQTITYNLPIFSDDYGQLDMSVGYRLGDNLEFSIQASNLTDSVQKTLMGFGAQQYGRSWFVADREYKGVVKMTF